MVSLTVYVTERGEYLPVIAVEGADGRTRELYRGSRHRTRAAAFSAMCEVWDDGGTPAVAEFKHGTRWELVK